MKLSVPILAFGLGLGGCNNDGCEDMDKHIVAAQNAMPASPVHSAEGLGAMNCSAARWEYAGAKDERESCSSSYLLQELERTHDMMKKLGCLDR